MGWNEAHRYYRTLHAVEAELDRRGDGVVVWRPDYAAVFDSPQQLLLALRTRWTTMVQAQVEEPCDADGSPSRELRDLAAAHRGLLLALVRNPADLAPADSTLAGVA